MQPPVSPHHAARRRYRFGGLGVTLAVVLTLAPGAPAVAAPETVRSVPDAPGASVTGLTLITGDQVRVEQFPDGRRGISVEPRDGESAASYEQLDIRGDLHVIPSDVFPYLVDGALDWELFNVDRLVAQRYDDAHAGTIPLIVSYGSAATASEAGVPAGARTTATLASLPGKAYRTDKREAAAFWESVDDDRKGVATAEVTPRLAGGIERIWLDRTVKAALDRSVPQIGAPDAWSDGNDGAGTTVAVLDTGVDADHPDLEGKVAEARNFTDSPTTGDAFGHGTHVAATVAGTGAASGGDRKGVAPGARLLVGKVLGDDGTGSLSIVLDGMEWAASSGADVVNLSLGAGPTDGTDPLSLALNRLTESTGTLFVASAGNDGPDEFTIGSPGAADAALTVGAVDRDETLASFSSRGPRLDDLALKPDITAPGVGIVAARASGTSMGTPVDEHYTAASGTSMAAPHVAGAAAILAGQHPAWGPEQLKDALVSTAERHPDYTPYAQGGGRVDVSRASRQGTYATGSLGFGSLSGGQSVTRDVRYTNHSGDPVTLNLDVTAGADAIDVPATVTVPAGGTASVAVTVDAAELPAGRYGGYLTATTSDGTVSLHTTLGAVKEAPRRTVRLTGVNRAGEPASVNPVLLYGTDRRYDVRTYIPAGSTRTVEVPEGDYFLHGVIKDRVPDGRVASLVVDPELEITKDMSLVLDARKANQVEIKTPRPAVQEGIFSFYTHRAVGDRRIGNGHMEYASSRRLYVTPTPDTREGTFEFVSRWQLTAPMISVRALTNGDEFDLDPRYLNHSPALDGARKLPVVDVGDGLAEDYQRLADDGVDLSGAAALVNGRSNNDEAAVKAAAKAGAAAVIVAAPAGSVVLTSWTPKGDRLPATAVVVTREEANRLRDALSDGAVTAELRGTPASPYLYDVMQVSRQRVPDRVLHHVTLANTATVKTRYTDNGGFPYTKEQRFGWRPWQDEAINQFQRHVPTAHEREEYVSANDTWWRHEVHHRSTWDTSAPLRGGMTGPIQRYEPGQRSNETWYAPVARPAIPRGVAGLTSYRSGDVLTIRIPEVADGQPGHYSRADRGDWGGVPADTVSGKLYRDDALIAEAKHAWGDFPAGGELGTYRLDLSVQRDTPEWRCSVRTDTSWSFESRRPGAGEKPLLPLLQLDYAVPVDLHGVAGDERAATLDITARHQAGLSGLAVAGMEVSASYDDGERWRDVPLTDQGDGRYQVRLEHPAASQGSGFVSLRVRAWDTDGNSVTQTVLRAYALG